MKIGFSAGNIGPIGTAEAIGKISVRAEDLGYDSLWTVERLPGSSQSWHHPFLASTHRRSPACKPKAVSCSC